MGETSRVGISASKVVALIGTLMLFWESYGTFRTQEVVPILIGVLGIVLGIIVFISLDIFQTTKLNVPYEPVLIFIIGLITAVLFYSFVGTYLGGSLIAIAGIVEGFSENKKYTASKVVGVIGAFWALICDAILHGILTNNIERIIWGAIGIALAIILLLTMYSKVNIRLTYSWWIVLIIGFTLTMFVPGLLQGYGGIIILVSFVLMLMAY